MWSWFGGGWWTWLLWGGIALVVWAVLNNATPAA